MDFSWTSYLSGVLTFLLLCLLFMAVMMLGCRGIVAMNILDGSIHTMRAKAVMFATGVVVESGLMK